MSIFRCSACGQMNRVSKDAGSERTPNCGNCKKKLDTSGAPQNVSGKELQRAVASSPVPVLVDVWAPWCGPCRAVAPVLDEIGRNRRGNVLILKLNSDENQEMSASLRVQAIPTMVLFRDGAEVQRKAGAMPKAVLDDWLKPHLYAA